MAIYAGVDALQLVATLNGALEYEDQVPGMNCHGPIAPAEDGPMFVPKPDSTLFWAATTDTGSPVPLAACLMYVAAVEGTPGRLREAVVACVAGLALVVAVVLVELAAGELAVVELLDVAGGLPPFGIVST
jgi:hypothetical protein